MALEFTIEETIDAPPEAVFDAATDLDGMGAWMTGFVKVERLTEGPKDNFEHILEQAEYLRKNMGPGDVAVSSYDDASLGYYLGQFVYGFLNSEHDDAFFVGLLDEAEKNGTKVWFLEIVSALGSCHTPGLDPHNIDCREKYRSFYMACRRTSVLYRPVCIPKVYP